VRGSFLAEQIWVSVREATQITGYNLDHVRRLARENWRRSENERLLRVRKDGHAYTIWLPDLINYIEKRIPATMQNVDLSSVEKTWVNAAEGSEMTGYHRSYISKLASQMLEKPENEREIRVKKRATGSELWLPDLVTYTHKVGRGPKKRTPKTS
jgi:hypothetical protein